MKRVLALILTLLMVVTLFAACGTSTTSSEATTASGESTTVAPANVTIGVCIYKYDDTYISSVRQALEAEAAAVPTVKLLLNDGKGDQATQNDQIDVLVQQKVNSLVINIVDTGAAQTVVDKAKAADIPVIFFNREPDNAIVKSYEKARFVGTTPSEAGVIQGEVMLDIWKADAKLDKNGDGKMQYLMLIGDPENPEAIARTKFSIDTVVAGGVQVEKLAEQVANWDSDKANAAVAAWISKFGDKIEFIVANNDGMASGAIAALQAAGYNKEGGDKLIPVVGVDATDEAKDLIAKGVMSGTVKQDAEGMAKAVFALSYNAAQGKDFIEGTTYKYDDTGVSVRIPYQPFKG